MQSASQNDNVRMSMPMLYSRQQPCDWLALDLRRLDCCLRPQSRPRCSVCIHGTAIAHQSPEDEGAARKLHFRAYSTLVVDIHHIDLVLSQYACSTTDSLHRSCVPDHPACPLLYTAYGKDVRVVGKLNHSAQSSLGIGSPHRARSSRCLSSSSASLGAR